MPAQHVKDLTHGNITREIIALAAPMVVGNILQEFYNTIDAFVVGRYAGEAQFAAIGVAGTVMNLFLYILVGSCSGFSIIFARAYGTRDMRELRKEFCSALLVGCGITLALMVLGGLGNTLLLHLLQTPDELIAYVLVYLKWILLALPAAFLYNLFNSVLRASGDINAALYVLAGSIASNLVLDLLLVARFSMGIEGAAIATAFTQLLSAVACGIYLHRTHPELHIIREMRGGYPADSRSHDSARCSGTNMTESRESDIKIHRRRRFFMDLDVIRTMINESGVDRLHIARMTQFGLVAACQQCSLYLGKMLVQGTVNACGTETIAAYTVGGRVEGFFNSFSTSGSTAASILVSQNIGIGDRERVNQTYRRSLRVQLIGGITACIMIILLAPPAAQFLLGVTEGLSYTAAIRYLRWIAPFYIVCFICSTHTGYFSGLGRLEIATFGTAGHIIIRFVISLLLAPRIGLVAVSLATGIGWSVALVYWRVSKVVLLRRARTNT